MNHRIVSTDPVATEIIAALGVSERLVAVSHRCDTPRVIADRPRVTHAIADGIECDEDALVAAAPSLVIARSGQGAADADAMISKLQALGLGTVRVVGLDGTSLDVILRDIERVGETLELGLVGLSIAGGLRARIDSVREAVAGVVPGRIACLGRLASLPWLSDLVAVAGGEIAATAAADLVLNCRADVDPEPALAAATTARSVVLDEAQASRFLRPGPRVAEAVEVFAALLHPERVPRLVARWSDVVGVGS
jgi:iron complex transport system substrate-binding protein